MKKEEDDMKWIEGYPTLKQVNPVSPFAVPQNYFGEMEAQLMGHIKLLEATQNAADKGFIVPVNYFNELEQNIQARVAIEAGLSVENTFKVPENYFEDLTQNIQSRIAIEEALNTEQEFTVPEGYFNELEQNIHARIAIEEALNTEQAFTVPEGYFNELEQNIQARIAIEQALNTEQAFTVPEGYFNELEQNIQARIAIEEALNTEQAFTVPDGYFAELENKILLQTSHVLPVKQASRQERQGIIVKMFVSSAFKYASAACFALVVGTAIFISEFNNPVATHNRSYLHKALSKVPADELENYLELNSDSATILENVDPDNFNAQQADTNKQVKNN
ncbi:hypothetical protein [uncultured Mucilaginibacter sp.]|uniref:hypothetical protein n=1 Tax=uncultured Mucilaginibacter sp. TaxID=797541 RepID=UPI0025FF397A|nr:hypothetical protein [uncultured Mucilaginibacter sp.]